MALKNMRKSKGISPIKFRIETALIITCSVRETHSLARTPPSVSFNSRELSDAYANTVIFSSSVLMQRKDIVSDTYSTEKR